MATLVYGDAAGGLGDVALRLVRFGLETSYANDLDELLLLAMQREQESGVGSVLVASDRDVAAIHELADQLEQRVCLPARSVVVVGPDLSDIDRESLSGRGLRWHLRSGFSDRDLRFVASAATWERDVMNLRKALRVPVDLPVLMKSQGEPRVARALDLSDHGAFIATHPDLDVGSRIGLELTCEAGSIDVEGSVQRTRKAERAPPEEPAAGLGVAFDSLADRSRTEISELLAAALSEFHLRG